MSFSNFSADPDSLISLPSVDRTLTEVKALFESSDSPENKKNLMETIIWEKVNATQDELTTLAFEDTDLSHDIIQQFFKSHPQYFEKQLESITTLEELRKLLVLSEITGQINSALDMSETMSKKIEIIKQKASLFGSASREEFYRFILKAKNLLSVQEISEIGKAYTAGDLDRLSFFAAVLTKINKINTLDDLQILLSSFSEEEKHLIVTSLTKAPNPLQHSLTEIKKIGLIMGLQGLFYEGYHTTLANQLTKQRFENLAPEGAGPLAFHIVNDYQTAEEFTDPIKEHGDYQGIHASWEQHSISFHLIKDGEKTHLIYVNRGQRHELAKKGDAAVHVFTFNDQDTMRPLISGLMEALKTEKRNEISGFIHNSLMSHHNPQLSQQLLKSNQKTGNCTVANANVAWHLTLASQKMKKDSSCSFSQAYKDAKVAYKDMRMEDRAKSFCELMTDQKLKDSGFQKNAAELIMVKMTNKDANNKETVRFLLNRLYEEDPDAVKILFDGLSLSEYKIDKYTQYNWLNACANKLKEEGTYDKEWARLVVQADIFQKLTLEQLKENLLENPSDINFIPKDTILNLLTESAIHHLSIGNIQYLLDDALSIRKDLISNLSVEQVSTLFKNDIEFNDLSEEQKENVDIAVAAYKENPECIKLFSDALVRKLLLSKEIDFNELSEEQKENIESLEYKAINHVAFYESLSTDTDFQVICKFNQSGDTNSLPMSNKRMCSYISHDFAQAVTEGQFEDWQRKITDHDKAMMLRGYAGERGSKWQQLEQQTRSLPNTTPGVSLAEKTLDASERQAISQKIANCFRRQNSWQSCMDSPCIFLSAGNMQRENSLVQFGHGMMFTMATTEDGKLDPEHLLFMDPNLGVLKIKNNVETIDKLMSSINEQLFSEFSVGSFHVDSVSKDWLDGKKPIPHSYALSKAALVDQYLDAQIMKLEKQKGSNLLSFLWKKPDDKIDTLRSYKQELRSHLKTYLRENPETREDNLIKFQKQLLDKIDGFVVSEKKSTFGFTPKKPKQEFNSLKENLDAMKEHESTCPTKYAKDFINNIVKEYEEEEEECLKLNPMN